MNMKTLKLLRGLMSMENKITDWDIREEILNNGFTNTCVMASAGTGKTTLLINKLQKLNEIDNSHKSYAILTFTNKATKEIKIRSSIGNAYISTIDSFVENEIIRPFMNDIEETRDYPNNYKVDFSNKFKFRDAGMDLLKNKGIMGIYNDNTKNFKFEYALNILEHSSACQDYLKSKYRMFFIDEYQDCDKDMHSFFMYICDNFEIPFFIIGDEKQSIYQWRGAIGNIFNEVSEKFKKYYLIHSFRCHFEINNFANLIHYPEAYVMSQKEVDRIIVYSDSENQHRYKLIESLIKNNYLDFRNEITIFVNNNKNAEQLSNLLKTIGYNFRYIPRMPIEDSYRNSKILMTLARFRFDQQYYLTNFIEDNFLEISRSKLKKCFDDFFNHDITGDTYNNFINNLSTQINLDFDENEKQSLLDTITNDQYIICFESDSKHNIMTAFAAKGLEFDQTVAFGSDYIYEEKNQLHYVAITRSKEKCIIIDDSMGKYLNKVNITIQKNMNEKNIKYKNLYKLL